ncbi:MAG: NAD-dependent succinate-semialdehyde dehydrogenase, partial [Gammaproteobacteria bacterium]|nr:NAD-dependent succinate-semialdehyde dehydrogenase [Gammaproteobacteria bacterium]
MSFRSTNPATSLVTHEYPAWTSAQINQALADVHTANASWAQTGIEQRANSMREMAKVLQNRREELALIITEEMGKLLSESRGEIDKCISTCEYYASNTAEFLANKVTESDASKSYVIHQPLGTVLAIMPWNFPIWQVMRFVIPALMAGNTGVLKHASNVPRCAMAIESIVSEAGFPKNVFRTLMISAAQTAAVIADPRVKAVTLTGSCEAGRKVASVAGQHLKKLVLELGGSDPFIVLDDADLDLAVPVAVQSRFMNAGQSCIAAKRFIVTENIADEFVKRFVDAVSALNAGDPQDSATKLAPMARVDLRDELHEQVTRSVSAGAVALTGCKPLEGTGAYYAASVLDKVTPDVPAYYEELFGPVALIIRAKDEADAVRIANDSPFGLGGSVWSKDVQRGENVALQLQCGGA